MGVWRSSVNEPGLNSAAVNCETLSSASSFHWPPAGRSAGVNRQVRFVLIGFEGAHMDSLRSLLPIRHRFPSLNPMGQPPNTEWRKEEVGRGDETANPTADLGAGFKRPSLDSAGARNAESRMTFGLHELSAGNKTLVQDSTPHCRVGRVKRPKKLGCPPVHGD